MGDEDYEKRVINLDLFFKALKCYMCSKPELSYGRLGGERGQSLSRAAFAVIIKLAGLANEVERVLKDLQSASLVLPEPKHDKAILEKLSEISGFAEISNYWAVASNMQKWLNSKK